MVAVLHCMTTVSGRVHVTGYETPDGGVLTKFTATCSTWHEVIAMIAIIVPVRIKISDSVLLDAHAEPGATRTRACEWAQRRQAMEARRVERFIREQQQEFDHWDHVYEDKDDAEEPHVSTPKDAAQTPHHATQHAREVLFDCEEAWLELRKASQNTLRRRWVTTITLLRAVGHVLLEVDTNASAVAREVIRQVFGAMKEPEPAIFWGFIKKERDLVVKQYRFAVSGELTIGLPPSGAGVPLALGMAAPGGSIVTDPLGTPYSTSKFSIRPLTDGPFAGRDPIEVVQDAIAFWHTCLNEIDKQVARRMQQGAARTP
jgi:hypothetical protein